MDELLRKAPKTLVAIVALIVGYFVIMAANPPRTLCDEQLDLFKQTQKSFLANQGKAQRSVAVQLHEQCKSENGPGGCFDYFLNLKKMVEDLERIPKSCGSALGEDALVKQWLLKSITLMTQIAWGEKPTAQVQAHRTGWMDASDFRLFCRIKVLSTRIFGEEEFGSFRDSLLASLPGAKELNREQIWSRSIFSLRCD